MLAALKRTLPKSLFGRALLILVLPTVLAQVMTAYVFYERHWDNVSRHMSSALAGEIAILVHEMHALPPSQRGQLMHMATRLMELEVTLSPGASALPKVRDAAAEFPQFHRQLKERLVRPFVIEHPPGAEYITVYVEMKGGTMQVTASLKRLVGSTTTIFILWMTGLAALLLLVATLFLRNQIRPIRQLAEAAESFGRGQEIAAFRPSGALEVRRAARAFVLMRERIVRQMQTRVEMLAGISHDLRTPLTRMKLELAMMQGEPVAALKSDVAQMEHMVQEYLDFARGEGREPTRTATLSALLADVIANYRRQGHEIALELTADFDLELRVHAFTRALTNVLDNAIRYGRRARIKAGRHAGYAEIVVDDEGPGIPEVQRALAFKPFTRLDPARNPGVAGAGLGLTIARDILLSHGGEILLTDAPSGGLRVILRVPAY